MITCKYHKDKSPQNGNCHWCTKHSINLDAGGVMCRRCINDKGFAALFNKRSDDINNIKARSTEIGLPCKHRGKLVGSCSCGSQKYICNLLGTAVRSQRRPGHTNEIGCNPKQCKKYEAESNRISEDKYAKHHKR